MDQDVKRPKCQEILRIKRVREVENSSINEK
jgi:hypothetical protein